MPPRLTNIPLKDFRGFLEKAGLHPARVKGGHEAWSKRGMTRPIIVQTHIDPVPAFIVRQAIRALDLTNEDFFRLLFCC